MNTVRHTYTHTHTHKKKKTKHKTNRENVKKTFPHNDTLSNLVTCLDSITPFNVCEVSHCIKLNKWNVHHGSLPIRLSLA